MASIFGNNSGDSLVGGTAADLLYGFDPAAQDNVSIDATRVANSLDSPVYVTAPAGDTGRLFIVERDGVIKTLDLATGQTSEFLDISDRVSTEGEQGLLGLAFDPNYASNGRFYVNYTNNDGDTEIRSFTVSSNDPDQAGTASTLLLSIDQPFTNHNGGWLDFGPDGYLYIGMGDGGGTGDPEDNAQDLNSLLGKMLRIDVTFDAFPSDGSRNYGIPADNPFVGVTGADEIWAYGLRNPWRASFDSDTGTFFIADVGQDEWEEIDIGAAGANYGWNHFEGNETYSSDPLTGAATSPIFVYNHDLGESITGGYVYRGSSSVLQGAYFYGDFISGRVWSLEFNGGQWVSTERTSAIDTSAGTLDNPVSFGEDASGNLYVVDFDGAVYRLTPEILDGADQLSGGGGSDTLFGGWQNDSLLGGADTDALYGNAGSDHLTGGQGGDWLFGGQDGDALVGQFGDDVLFGDADSDLVYGNQGADWVLGNQGADQLFGGQDADTIFGGRDSDWLTGDGGDDVLSGDAGADFFYFAAFGGNDVVLDFSAAEGDRLAVASGAVIAVSQNAAGEAVIDFGIGTTVTLAGIAPGQVSAEWFMTV